MKKIFLPFVVFVVTNMSYAQNTLVATLSHGDDISIFYGINAFQQAHDAATDGDVINLSGGVFYGSDITKAITLRGAGAKNSSLPTSFYHRITFNIPSSSSNSLSLEGCCLSDGFETKDTLSNASFLKCIINSASLNGKTENIQFLNCEVHSFRINSDSCSTIFVNSYIDQFINYSLSTTEFLNCVVYAHRAGSYEQVYHNTMFTNCIVWGKVLQNSCSAYNCIGIGDSNNFQYVHTFNCYDIGRDYSSLFIDGVFYNDLTDEAKEKYLGTDGTPIGMFGGTFPYNMTPFYPQITKMNVANKTTADGKLSVEIEVSTAE